MTRMLRKQIYIEKRQRALLKRLAKKCGVSEAEIIRQAIDHETLGGPVPAVPLRPILCWITGCEGWPALRGCVI